jgi:hypothetical protein
MEVAGRAIEKDGIRRDGLHQFFSCAKPPLISPARRMPRMKKSRTCVRAFVDAMAVQNELIVATRNGIDFRHAKTFNPWTDSK